MKMTLNEIASAAVHLAEVRWFGIKTADGFEVVEHRAVFYRDRVAWKGHPWDVGGGPGVDFVDEWAYEIRYRPDAPWRPTGRSNPGWKSLRATSPAFESARDAVNEQRRRSALATERHRDAISALESILTSRIW